MPLSSTNDLMSSAVFGGWSAIGGLLEASDGGVRSRTG
jgi:hypothetical protein